jgi:hypothetical protein
MRVRCVCQREPLGECAESEGEREREREEEEEEEEGGQ